MSERLRVLLVVYNLTGKGTYRRAFQFGRQLAARGHEVTLLSASRTQRLRGRITHGEGMTLAESPDLFTGSLRSGWDAWNTLYRINALRGQRFDIVHAFEARPSVIFPALFAQRAGGAALVMDWADWFGRGGSVEERPNPLVRAVLRPVETFCEEHFRTRAQGTTAICTTLRARAIALGVPPESIRLLPNGSETDRLQVREARGARERLGLPCDGFIIGYIGSIFRGDALLMAQAFDAVRAQLPDARLLVIGYCPVDIASLTRTRANVIQTGFISEASMNDYLSACDLCWLPLRDTNANRGRWPLKLNDYMAVGRATVATAVGDVTALLQQEPIGLLAPDAPEPFAAQTVCLLRDEPRRTAMGRRARALAETRFDWAHLTDELEQLYHEARARRRATDGTRRL